MQNNDIHSNFFKLRVLIILSGVLLDIGGMVMILMDLKSEGSISVKSPLFSGDIRATYIGLLVIFLGVLLQTVAILRKYDYVESVEITRKPGRLEFPKLNQSDKLLLPQPPQKLEMPSKQIELLDTETIKYKSESKGARLAEKSR